MQNPRIAHCRAKWRIRCFKKRVEVRDHQPAVRYITQYTVGRFERFGIEACGGCSWTTIREQIAPDQIGLALMPADVIALHKDDKRAAAIWIENGYPIGLDIKRVKEIYDRGGRHMSLAHNGNSQLPDSNTGEAQGIASPRAFGSLAT